MTSEPAHLLEFKTLCGCVKWMACSPQAPRREWHLPLIPRRPAWEAFGAGATPDETEIQKRVFEHTSTRAWDGRIIHVYEEKA